MKYQISNIKYQISSPFRGIRGGIVGLLAIVLAGCNNMPINPEIDPAYCPSEVTIVLPAREAALLYNDPSTGVPTLPLLVGEKVALQWTLTPDTATFTDVLWVSSYPANVSVNAEGQIEALSAAGLGYSIISVTPKGMYSASGVTASLRVKVSETLIAANAIDISQADGENSVFVGNTLQLSANILPTEATYRTVTWSSENEEVATVSEEGMVTGISTHGALSETVNITATAMDGSGVVGSFAVRVKDVVDPSAVTLNQSFNKDNYACCIYDKYLILPYTTVPEESTFSKIVWESSDPDIATVQDGVVYFNQDGHFGEFTITATCPNGASDQIRMNMPAGLMREQFTNPLNFTWNVMEGEKPYNNTSTAQEWHEEGYITCYTYAMNAENQRGDIKAAGKVWICPANYPIIAFKMDYVLDKYSYLTYCAFKFDCVSSDEAYKGELGGGDKRWNTCYKCSDGSRVFIYDFSKQAYPTGGIINPTDVVEFKTFQIKYADMRTTSEQLNFNVYWVQTFKSIEEVNAALDAEGVTYTE